MTPNSTSAEQQEPTFYCHDYDEGNTDEKCNFPCGNSWCEQKPTIYPENQEDWITYHEKILKQNNDQLTHLAGQLHTKEVEYEMMKEDIERLKGVEKELTRLLTEATQSLETLTEYWQNSYSIEQIEQAYSEWEFNDSIDIPFTEYLSLKQQKEGK